MLTSLSEHMDTLKKQHFKRKALAPSAASERVSCVAAHLDGATGVANPLHDFKVTFMMLLR